MSNAIEIVRTVSGLRERVADWRRHDVSIALVPTMGALHAGHLALVERARSNSAKVIVSIFVNPAQFGPGEDLSRYPRDEVRDAAQLASVAADLIFAPEVGEMYPAGFSTAVRPGSAAHGLEGAIRPHHFAGVATVCCKLFSQSGADFAIFGEKDFQQLAVLRQMVSDLNLPLTLVAAPTVRDADGLALSSRNAYLTAEERRIAPALFREISALAREVRWVAGRNERTQLEGLTAACMSRMLASGYTSIDYVAVRNAETLEPVTTAGGRNNLRILAAARLGVTRLIDNVAV